MRRSGSHRRVVSAWASDADPDCHDIRRLVRKSRMPDFQWLRGNGFVREARFAGAGKLWDD
jgi:hypothetical protein